MIDFLLNKNNIKCVVLDAMGVIYQVGDDVGELLIPFLKSKGCLLSENKIQEAYIKCSRGEISSLEFWNEMGITNESLTIDHEYVNLHKLTEGIADFLIFLKNKGIRTACLTNDVNEWSILLRKNFNLEQYISYWLVSGEIGIRKPDKQIYLSLLKTLELKPEECLFIDDRLGNVNAAKNLGFHSIQYVGNMKFDIKEIRNEQIITNFQEIKKCL